MNKIQYLKNHKIDRKKWSIALAECTGRHLFAESWFLDIVSPNWQALITENYESIFPLPVKSFFGFEYLVQPEFTAQLGMFSKIDSTKFVDNFVSVVRKKFRRYDFNLNTGNFLSKYEGKPMVNCELSLDKTFSELHQNFSKNTKRNIKKAEKKEGFEIKKIDFEEYFDFKIQNLNGPPPANYNTLRQLNAAFVKHSIQVECHAYFHDENCLASAMFVKYHNRIYYFNGASSPMGKDFKAMFAIFNFFINQEGESNQILDFKGGQMVGTNRFFKGFGAVEKPYIRVARKF